MGGHAHRGNPGAGFLDRVGGGAVVVGGNGDEDAGAGGIEQGQVNRVVPGIVAARDGVVQHMHAIGHGLVDGGQDGAGGAGWVADFVGDQVGMGGHAGDQVIGGAGAPIGYGGGMHIARGDAGDIGAVTIAVFGGGGGGVEIVGGDQLVIAEGWVAQAMPGIDAAAPRVGVIVAIGGEVCKGGVGVVDAGIYDADDHALAAGGLACGGVALPDVVGVDPGWAGIAAGVTQGIGVDGLHARQGGHIFGFFWADFNDDGIENVGVAQDGLDVAANFARSQFDPGVLRLLQRSTIGNDFWGVWCDTGVAVVPWGRGGQAVLLAFVAGQCGLVELDDVAARLPGSRLAAHAVGRSSDDRK